MNPLLPADGLRSVNAESFADGLQAALDSVVRISMGAGTGQGKCCGWLVTPQLVVLPAYMLAEDKPAAQLRVALHRAGGAGWEDQVDDGEPAELLQAGLESEPQPLMDLAIVRLAGAHPAPGMAFRQGPPEPGELVLMAYHGQPGDEKEGASLAFGELESATGWAVHYRAAQRPGSGGAALYDLRWRFLGVHLLSSGPVSSGPGQAGVMAMLQRSRWWREIARHQNLADVVAVRQSLNASSPAGVDISPALMRAALRFSMPAAALDPTERTALAEHVVDACAASWTLTPSVRRMVLAASPFEVLLEYLPSLPSTPEQRVIAPILRGGPYHIEQASEDDLAHWLQAVRWFAGLAPGLPGAAYIFQRLQLRRVRGRLARIAGPDFVGRAAELALLRSWFDSGVPAALTIWGIGGIGKSALVAHFLLALPATTMLLWLDFDRADLAPDDAASVIAALREQAQVQRSGAGDAAEVAPADPLDQPPDQQRALATARAALTALLEGEGARRIVIVLDSFEAAQYVERYQELWPELEALAQRVTGLQVIVSGRARVPALRFRAELALEIALTGLEATDVRQWLGRHGIPPGPEQDEVVRLAAGLPLVLKLAECLVAANGKLEGLPAHLPDQMVAGFLYERIIDRVHEPRFRDLAKGAIVLRRLSADMIAPVFGNLPLALPPGPASEWFGEFAREAALVEGEEELCLRPEVRSAALALLERQQPALVRSIDARALAWYDTRDQNDPQVAAERVYHALRLDDEAGAMNAWRDGCGTYLQYAQDTLHGGASTWLARRLGTSASLDDGGSGIWELEAAARIATSRGAGLTQSAQGVLSERSERRAGGALAFHEAYEDWIDGRREVALGHLLQHGIDSSDTSARERAMLAALIYAEFGQSDTAAAILQHWSERRSWRDRKDGAAEQAAVHAARVCLMAPLALEDSFVLTAQWPHGVLAMDFLRDEARARASLAGSTASAYEIALPEGETGAEVFLNSLRQFRQATSVLGVWNPQVGARPAPGGQDAGLAGTLVKLAWQRWAVLAEGAMVELLDCSLKAPAFTPLNRSVMIVLSVFTGVPGLELQHRGESLEALLSAMQSRLLPASLDTVSLTASESPYSSAYTAAVSPLRRQALQWCGPDLRPLRQLVQRFASRLEEG